MGADLPPSDAGTTDLPGSGVSYDGYAFESTWWVKALRPDPEPGQPDAIPWKVLGRIVTTPAPGGD